jgi:hypothetical protein
MPTAFLAFLSVASLSEPDFSTVESTVRELYSVISGPAGQARDWDRLRSIFAPGARMVPVVVTGGSRRAISWTVEDYIKNSGPYLEQKGFFEREVKATVERYGPVAHVWSQYECWMGQQEGEPDDRGVNSIQLSHDGQRWWVQSVSWSSEKSGAGPAPVTKGSIKA